MYMSSRNPLITDVLYILKKKLKYLMRHLQVVLSVAVAMLTQS